MEDRSLMQSVSEMIDTLRGIYGPMMTEAILYGSYARGTQTDESDVDIAIFIAGSPTKETKDLMIACVVEHELECGKVLSVIDIDAEKYRVWKDTLPFYKNIQKDGIVLWKAS